MKNPFHQFSLLITAAFLMAACEKKSPEVASAHPQQVIELRASDSLRIVGVPAIADDRKTVSVEISVDGTKQTKIFTFPREVSDVVCGIHMKNMSIAIAAKPVLEGPWYWGIAYTGGGYDGINTTQWNESPPHSADLLAVSGGDGDTLLIYAAQQRRGESGTMIEHWTYLNHCPGVVEGRDISGFLYSYNTTATPKILR
jgi:hypothetical protein